MTGILRAFGALFFNLNTAPVEANGHSRAKAETDESARGTVLVIDDDASIHDVMRPLLCAEGFTVLTAVSGAKGLDMLRYCQRDVRLVVLDYNMPRFNGADTLAFLRKLNPHVKVIAVTGVDRNLLPEVFREGVDKVLPKPYSTGQLIDTINALLGGAPAAAVSAS